MFDPSSFMETTVDTKLDTKADPIPEGTYAAEITELKPDSVTNKKTGEENYLLRITYEIKDEALREQLHREKLTVRQDIWLDVTPDGKLDLSPQRNIRLGQIAEAAGLNGRSTWSIGHLQGATVKIRTGLRSDKDDESRKYVDVKNVSKL